MSLLRTAINRLAAPVARTVVSAPLRYVPSVSGSAVRSFRCSSVKATEELPSLIKPDLMATNVTNSLALNHYAYGIVEQLQQAFPKLILATNSTPYIPIHLQTVPECLRALVLLS